MSRKQARVQTSAPAGSPSAGLPGNSAPTRARTEMEFENPEVLGTLFGQFDANLVQIENRLGVYISARGNRIQIEGSEEAVARAREVLSGMHTRLKQGFELDQGAVESLIAMSSEPTLEGIITGDDKRPPIMIRTRKKTIVPRSAAQIDYMQALTSNEVIFALGPAGTGKTYLAVAQAVAQLITGSVQRLILSRPAVEAGERIGFLPGDMKDKVDPYMQPLYDALNDFLPGKQMAKLLEDKRIEIAPLAFMRGRTLSNAFVVLDEAQNATTMQMKMFLTRLGEGSRMVITGDRSQVDLPRGVKSGLRDAEAILKGVSGVSFSYFSAKDVVRHPLVAKIIEAYDAADAET